MKSGLELRDGEEIGRDPREMTQEEIQACGHEPMPVLAAIRARCLDCCGGQPSEVRKCTAVACALWPFRQNKNPWRTAREVSDEERQTIAERFAAARARKIDATPISQAISQEDFGR